MPYVWRSVLLQLFLSYSSAHYNTYLIIRLMPNLLIRLHETKEITMFSQIKHITELNYKTASELSIINSRSITVLL